MVDDVSHSCGTDAGFAVVYEFKHYKPKKKLISTRCWTFMERDELKEGGAALELWVKWNMCLALIYKPARMNYRIYSCIGRIFLHQFSF